MNTSQQQLDLIFRDPSARKHGGNECSIAAHKKIVPTKQLMYRRIMEFAAARGSYGFTLHEICAAFGKTPNEISGRLSELVHKLKWLRRTNEKRHGCSVLVDARL